MDFHLNFSFSFYPPLASAFFARADGTSPAPSHSLQVVTFEKAPRMVFLVSRTLPAPPQTRHSKILFPDHALSLTSGAGNKSFKGYRDLNSADRFLKLIFPRSLRCPLLFSLSVGSFLHAAEDTFKILEISPISNPLKSKLTPSMPLMPAKGLFCQLVFCQSVFLPLAEPNDRNEPFYPYPIKFDTPRLFL